MPKTVFTPQELRAYFNGELASYHTKEAREHEAHFRIHADGIFPAEIIEERRPHEAAEVMDYRQKIWKPKTKPVFTKVFNSLSKIRRSADWALNFPNVPFNRIPDDETLQQYCEKKFPYFTSITNWAFTILLRNYLIDPNAVLLMKPLGLGEEEIDQTEFTKPFPEIFNSLYVIDFKEEDYAVLQNPTGSVFYTDRAERGFSFWVVTTERIMRYDQSNNGYQKTIDVLHGLGFLPCYKLGGVLIEAVEGDFLYESRVAGMLTGLDEAVREYSDLQAAKVMHIYPERWEISQTECPDCQGTGFTLMTDNVKVECGRCHGACYVTPEGPYSKLVIGRGNLDVNSNTPIPPAGFVEKDVEIVKLQESGVAGHIRAALAAINMEHLDDTPLAQSGIAKEVDRDETNNFVHSVAEDIVRILDWVVLASAGWRYQVQYSPEQIMEMLPNIPVPEHFDIFSTKFVEEEVKVAKDNKLNPTIISAIEKAYASKKFSSEPEVRDVLMLVLDLDPLPNITDEEKVLRLQNQGIRQLDYILSSNIQGFIQRAQMEYENFPELDYANQKEILEGYAKEVEDSNSTANDPGILAAIKGNQQNNQDANNSGQAA